MNADAFATIAIGDIVNYTLPPSQRPANPQQEYRGVVNKVYANAQMLIVTLLDAGYEGMSEPVYLSQIRSAGKPEQERRA